MPSRNEASSLVALRELRAMEKRRFDEAEANRLRIGRERREQEEARRRAEDEQRARGAEQQATLAHLSAENARLQGEIDLVRAQNARLRCELERAQLPGAEPAARSSWVSHGLWPGRAGHGSADPVQHSHLSSRFPTGISRSHEHLGSELPTRHLVEALRGLGHDLVAARAARDRGLYGDLPFSTLRDLHGYRPDLRRAREPRPRNGTHMVVARRGRRRRRQSIQSAQLLPAPGRRPLMASPPLIHSPRSRPFRLAGPMVVSWQRRAKQGSRR